MRKPAALIICGVLAMGLTALAGCSAFPSSSDTSPSVDGLEADEPEALEQSFLTVVLPDGWESEEDCSFSNADGGSIRFSIHDASADELATIEMRDGDFLDAGIIGAGGLAYTVIESEQTDESHWIVGWEDKSIEATASHIDDKNSIQAFLDGVRYKEDAYRKWLLSS